jgi:hypothetical protein
VSNPFGQYSFASVEDFAAGRRRVHAHARAAAARGRRVERRRGGGAPVDAVALVQRALRRAPGGERVRRPRAGNPALEQALGVRTGAAPARLHLSPRAGFSFTYNRDRENGSGTSETTSAASTAPPPA